MKHDKKLQQVQTQLKDYFCFFKEDKCLVVSEDKMSKPFAYVVRDANHPDNILISFRIDYKSAANAANVALNVNDICHVKLLPQFFYTKHNQLHFGDDAQKFYDYEMELPLEFVHPLDDTRH